MGPWGYTILIVIGFIIGAGLIQFTGLLAIFLDLTLGIFGLILITSNVPILSGAVRSNFEPLLSFGSGFLIGQLLFGGELNESKISI